MKLIIDIPNEDYAFLQQFTILGLGMLKYRSTQVNILNAIKQGIPLEYMQKGAWIIKSDEEGFWYECNICGFRPSELTGICPHCNSDMGGYHE